MPFLPPSIRIDGRDPANPLTQYRNGFLPNDIKIVGYARTKMDHEEYLRRIKSYIKTPTKDIEQQLEDFASLCTYVSGQYDRDESFTQLNKHLEELEKGRPETNRLFYMALPPSVFTIVSQHLKKCCYPSKGIARVIVGSPVPEPRMGWLLTRATG